MPFRTPAFALTRWNVWQERHWTVFQLVPRPGTQLRQQLEPLTLWNGAVHVAPAYRWRGRTWLGAGCSNGILSCHSRKTDIVSFRMLQSGKVLMNFFFSKYIFFFKARYWRWNWITYWPSKLGRKKRKASLVSISVFFVSMEISAVGSI